MAKNITQLMVNGQSYELVLEPQCGFCSSGMIRSTKALLDKNPQPTEREIKEALAGN